MMCMWGGKFWRIGAAARSYSSIELEAVRVAALGLTALAYGLMAAARLSGKRLFLGSSGTGAPYENEVKEK